MKTRTRRHPKPTSPRKTTNLRPQVDSLETRLLLTAGDLDLSFGVGGYLLANAPSSTLDAAYATAIQDDGRILVAGSGDNPDGTSAFQVIRLTATGMLDTSFGSEGHALALGGDHDAYMNDMVLQPDGKIVLVGSISTLTTGKGKKWISSDIALVRLLPDGQPDPSFGSGGTVVTGFSTVGQEFDSAYEVALQADDNKIKIVVAGRSTSSTGSDGILVRYNPDGSLDDSFGTGGKVVASVYSTNSENVHGLAIQDDGRIVVKGAYYDEWTGLGHVHYLARYNSDGSLDDGSAADSTPTDEFGTDGRFVLPYHNGGGLWLHPVTIQPDGAIVSTSRSQAGIDDDILLCRLTPEGDLDTTFGGGAGIVTLFLPGEQVSHTVTVQPDGRITVVGTSDSDSMIARFLPDGSLDSGFGNLGVVFPSFSTGSVDFLNDVIVQADGTIVAVGAAATTNSSQSFLIARFLGDSTPGIAVTPTSGLVTSESGASASVHVALATQPTADVTIPVASGDATEATVSTSLLTFTPATWNVPQTVTVTGVDDALSDGDVAYAIILGAASSLDPDYDGLDPADVSATNSDDETPTTRFYVVNDGTTDRTFEYATAGNAVEDYSLNSGNTSPRGVATTATGDKVWVVDANRNVYVYDTAGGLIGSWSAGSMVGNAKVEGIATDGTDVWILDARNSKIFRYAGAATRTSGSQSAASSFILSIANPNTSAKGIVTDGTYLWALNDSSTDKVFKYTLTGGILGSWTITGAGTSPTGITIDPSNVDHVWIVDSGTDRVYQFDNAASRISGSQSPSTSFALAPGNTNPQGIADPPMPSSAAPPVTVSTGIPHPRAHLAALQRRAFPRLSASRSTLASLPSMTVSPSILGPRITPVLIPFAPSTGQDHSPEGTQRFQARTKRARIAIRV